MGDVQLMFLVLFGLVFSLPVYCTRCYSYLGIRSTADTGEVIYRVSEGFGGWWRDFTREGRGTPVKGLKRLHQFVSDSTHSPSGRGIWDLGIAL